MIQHDKETIIGLQKFDCNCNDCKFMDRDMVEYNLWKGYTEHLQYVIFLRERMKLFNQVCAAADNGSIDGAKIIEARARKLNFQFDKRQLTISYGVCLSRKGKWSQPVTFMPGSFQPDTQHCFVHRRDVC